MFLNPLGLLALVGVPAVVAIHLFRRRFRPHVVSAVFLWRQEDALPVAGRRRERLRTSASFWLEVVLALLLALLFAGPVACGSADTRHLVVVLDSSASMDAAAKSGRVRDRAQRLVSKRIRALSTRSRVTLVRSGPRPEVLAGPGAFQREALDALDSWRPRAARHELGPTVSLALQIAGGGAVLLVTDAFEPERFPGAVDIAALGSPTENVAIVHATRSSETIDGQRFDRVFVAVKSYCFEPVVRELELRIDGRALESRRIRLEPEQKSHIVFELPSGTLEVEVALTPDALTLDDTAWLAPPPRKPVFLATGFPSEMAARIGLTSGESDAKIDRWTALVTDGFEVEDPKRAHVVIGPELVAGSDAWSLVLETAGDRRRDLVGPFLAEKGHPLLDGLTLEGIVWSIDPDLLLTGAALVSAGNDPILVEEREGRRRIFRMNYDPLRSSLHRSPDWPILLHNLVELRRAELPGPRNVNIAVGEPFVYQTEEPGSFLVKQVDGGEELEVHARNLVVVEGLELPGLYTLSNGQTELCRFGLRFEDAAESDLRIRSSGSRESSAEFARVQGETGWLDSALLALAIGVLLADWLVLSRKVPLASPA